MEIKTFLSRQSSCNRGILCAESSKRVCLFAQLDARHPTLEAGVPEHASNPAGVIRTNGFIYCVLGQRDITQIAKTVIGAHSIDVVYTDGVNSIHHLPNKSMNSKIPPEYPHKDIALRENGTGITACELGVPCCMNGRAAATSGFFKHPQRALAPDKSPAIKVIQKKSLKEALGW